MSPYLGRGASRAMIDAMSLAEALKSSLEQGQEHSLPDRLSAYESDVLEQGFQAAGQSMMAQRMTLNAGDTPWKAFWRNLTLKVLDWWIRHPQDIVEGYPGTCVVPKSASKY